MSHFLRRVHRFVARCARPFAASVPGSLLVSSSALHAALWLTGLTLAGAASAAVEPDAVTQAQAELLDEYCERCHNDERLSGNWSLSAIDIGDVEAGRNRAQWEKILRMARRGEMPPPERPQPSADERAAFIAWLEGGLDGYAAAHPDPGRATLRRLNRAEYANAVKTLLALDIDVSDGLPADDSGYGFDNIADVLSLSPTLMDRYLAVAGSAAKLAVGLGPDTPFVTSVRVPKDGSIKNQGVPAYNERRHDDLPLDSRGGWAFDYYAPQDGAYEIAGILNANTNNEVDRLPENRVALRVPLKAGPHSLGMAFRREVALDESVQTLRNTTDIIVMPTEDAVPLTLDFIVDGARVGSADVPSYYMSERFSQRNFPRDVLQLDVEGPFDAQGPGETPSRRKLLVCTPSSSRRSEDACARKILTALARQAWRRPVEHADIDPLLRIFSVTRDDADYLRGISVAVQALLVSPEFLFLIERDPPGAKPGSVHPISDLEFASRLSLFLWSGLPDEELLQLAAKNRLRDPAVLRAQLTRMLDDPRAQALTQNFAGQWLYLRNLDYQRPDVMLYPEFDVRLRAAMRRETELFFASMLREDRSVLDFIRADDGYLNEQLAAHYGIAGVEGPALRHVTFAPDSGRGGLLGQASILTVTSYGNRTSVVKRGKWILDNLLAAPPPPPPPDVPALQETRGGKLLDARAQIEAHREDPACASCHVKMDPLGFALEHYDPVGAYRVMDAGFHVDASAQMPDGTQFEGLGGLQDLLLARRDQFTEALTERMLTYALGRGLEAPDQPTVRAIARHTAEADYRMRALIFAIVTSEPFNFRRTPAAAGANDAATQQTH